MIAYLKLPPFIATLGTQMMGMGFGAIITKVTTMPTRIRRSSMCSISLGMRTVWFFP
jgi:ribose/xylose/arabinose/galactoside ABC-type transport system permease subunit